MSPCREVCHEPKQHINDQGRVNLPAHRVGAGETVPRWRGDAESCKDAGFEPVTDIVETHGVGEMSEEHLLEDDHIGADWCSFVHTLYRVAGISTQH